MTDPRDVEASELLDDLRRWYAPDQSSRISIRELSRRTGIAFSTIRDIVSGTTRVPRQQTLARIFGASEVADVRISQRQQSWAIDAPAFTESALAAIQQIPGTVDVKFVYRTDQTTSRRGTSVSVSWLPGGLPTMARVAGVPLSSITRVILRRGGA